MNTSTIRIWLLVLLCASLAACTVPPAATATPALSARPPATSTSVPPTSTTPPQPTPTQVAPPVTVVVQPDSVQQTIREIGGGNFIHRFSQVSVPLDPVGALNLDTLGMRVARVRMDREDWEPVNDNDGTYHHVASSEAGTLQPVQVLNVTGGATEVTLMPRSVKVLTTQAP